MRNALEREVLTTLPPFDADALAEVRDLGERGARAAERGDVLEMRLANHEFHFAIFDRSPLALVVGGSAGCGSWRCRTTPPICSIRTRGDR